MIVKFAAELAKAKNMIVVENAVISDDIAENYFVCDLTKCKGACCVEGDLGAPLLTEELPAIEEVYPAVEPYLTEEGKEAIKKQGMYVFDEDGEFSTPTIDGKECAYATYDENGILKCSFEQAFNDKKTKFKKPISCHLYPIRITKYDDYDAVNYDRWEICNPACKLGMELKVPLYKFLKEPLIRKFGKEWYDKLCKEIKNREVEGERNKGQVVRSKEKGARSKE